MAWEDIVERGYGTPRQFIFNSISALGDLEFQRATWLDPAIRNPHYSYVEFVECFYDYCAGDWRISDKSAPGSPFLSLVEQEIVSEEERDVIWDVHLALSSGKQIDQYDHSAILADERWQSVVSAAANAVARLRSMLTDAQELAALKNVPPSDSAKNWP